MLTRTYTSLLALFFVLLLNLVAANCDAQSSGYQGKKFLIKVDALTPALERGIAAELEYAFHRNFAATLQFGYTNAQYKQVLPGYELHTGLVLTDKASIRDLQVGIGGKVYFNNALPAPKRNYFFARYLVGKADINGNYFTFNALDPSKEYLQDFSLSGVSTSKTTVGFGYQNIFWNIVALDIDMGISLGAITLTNKNSSDGQDYNYIITGFSDRYGPNIATFGNWRQGKAGGIGLNASIKIGVLLF